MILQIDKTLGLLNSFVKLATYFEKAIYYLVSSCHFYSRI